MMSIDLCNFFKGKQEGSSSVERSIMITRNKLEITKTDKQQHLMNDYYSWQVAASSMDLFSKKKGSNNSNCQ